MTSKAEAHVVLRPPSTIACLRCGQTYEVNTPAPVDVLLAAMKAFAATHDACKKHKSGRACSFCYNFGHDEQTCPLTEYHGDYRNWLAGPDTGVSSKAICRKLSGTGYVLDGSTSGFGNTPMDPSDFGRCHRLLHAIAGWRARIVEMADDPHWKALVDRWDELEALFLEESPLGTCPKLYARMQELGA